MTTKLAKSENQSQRPITAPHYPRSVVDDFLEWVDRLPIPAWSFYLLILVALIGFFNALAWIDGTLPFLTFDLYRSSIPVYPVASLAMVHYLNRVAHRALAEFRPVLNPAEDEYEQFEYTLVTLPRRGTWMVLGLSLAFTVVYILFTPYLMALFGLSPILAFLETVMYAFCFGMIAVLLYHILWQLRTVSCIHAQAAEINLFHRTPLYAFSKLTAQSGIGLLLINYFGVLTDPATFENMALFGLTIVASLLSLLCFVLPLRGIHNKMVMEKNRQLAQCNGRLQAAIKELYDLAAENHLSGVEGLNQLISSLVTTREIIKKLPTWPWEPGTLMTFISVFLLPLIGRVIIWLIEQFGLFEFFLP